MILILSTVRVENLTSSASALASSISVFIRALQQEGFFNAKSRSRERFDILDIMSNLHRECGTRKNDYLCTELFELKLLFRFLCFMDEGLKVQMDLKVILFPYL